VPDGTTILRFRHLLEEHGLTKQIFDEIQGLLAQQRLSLRSGTNRGRMLNVNYSCRSSCLNGNPY